MTKILRKIWLKHPNGSVRTGTVVLSQFDEIVILDYTGTPVIVQENWDRITPIFDIVGDDDIAIRRPYMIMWNALMDYDDVIF